MELQHVAEGIHDPSTADLNWLIKYFTSGVVRMNIKTDLSLYKLYHIDGWWLSCNRLKKRKDTPNASYRQNSVIICILLKLVFKCHNKISSDKLDFCSTRPEHDFPSPSLRLGNYLFQRQTLEMFNNEDPLNISKEHFAVNLAETRLSERRHCVKHLHFLWIFINLIK